MKKTEITNVLEYLKENYSTFGDVEGKYTFWSPTLINYSYEDVIGSINNLMQRKEFLTTPPTLMTIVAPLRKTEEKIDLEDEGKLFPCQFCHRLFKGMDEMVEHEDRCRSIRYIERQCKRFNLGTIDKKEFYEMDEDTFQERYKKLLKLVQERTTNEFEKQIIGNIFNPPRPEEAKRFLKGERNNG